MRAIIVDDSRAMRTILRRLCIESGYTDVTEAPDLATARLVVVDARADLVIVDWRLPDGTATDLVRALRSEGETATCIVLAPSSIPDAAEQARAAGANDCVPKPFTGDDLRCRLAAPALSG